MKKLLLLIILFVPVYQVNAQTPEQLSFKRHEIKLDAYYLISGIANVSGLKIEYEYWFDNWGSAGLMGFYGFWKQTKIQRQALGFYRFHLRSKPKSVFYIEGNFGVSYGFDIKKVGPSIFDLEQVYRTRFGLGAALGWKFIIPQPGITVDIYVGRGRFIIRESGFELGKRNYPRLGICVGKLF